MRLAVIISTYNSPEWLEKVLWGYSMQTLPEFQIVIADDGSDDSTRERIDDMREHLRHPVEHRWHEAPTYARQTILNRCIAEVDADYIVMTDGDCIPRPDFLEVHARLARPGWFLSGGYCKLPMETSRRIEREDIVAGRCFDLEWILRQGPPPTGEVAKKTPGAAAVGPSCRSSVNDAADMEQHEQLRLAF